MKPLLVRTIGSLLAVLVSASLRIQAQGLTSNDTVHIEVRVQSGQDRKDIAKSTADTVTQYKALTIVMSGKAKSPETRIGKWVAYGRSLKNNEITALESGEFKIDLASGPQTIESKKISTTYTPEHSVLSTSHGRAGNAGSSHTTAKKVVAEGKKFIGIGVSVREGDKIVGEYFDPVGLKAEVTK
jgi:hypothetical protein